MCLKLAHDMGLFEHLGHRDSSPKTTAELADLTKSDADFLKRILRHLAARGVVVELSTPADSYQATELSETLISEASSGIRYSHSTYMPVMQQAPAYLRSIGFVSPKDNRDGIFQNTIGEPGLTKFEWEQKPGNEERKKDFDQLMRYSTKYRKSWMDTFSPEGLAEASKDPNGTLLVDVGGGTGTDVAEFKRRFPKAIGKVILQDLPATIQTAREKNGYLLSEVSCLFGLCPV